MASASEVISLIAGVAMPLVGLATEKRRGTARCAPCSRRSPAVAAPVRSLPKGSLAMTMVQERDSLRPTPCYGVMD